MNNIIFYLLGFALGIAFEYGLIRILIRRNIIGTFHTAYKNGECTKCIFELYSEDVMDGNEGLKFVIFKVGTQANDNETNSQ